METIRMNIGKISLMVNDDPKRVIFFNPTDLAFVERFYKLLSDFKQKQKDFIAKAKDIDDRGGSFSEGISLLKEMCDYMRTAIDEVFGSGTSEAAFEDAYTLNMFEQFFTSITPYVNKARSAKMDKYIRQAESEILT